MNSVKRFDLAVIAVLTLGMLYFPSPAQAAYQVGVDYHSTTANPSNAFITRYHQPEVRSAVRSQLQGMADAGAKIISLRVWLTFPPNFTGYRDPSAIGFPPSTQELQNIRQFVEDASVVKGQNGHYLEIYLGTLRQRCAHLSAYNDPKHPECRETWSEYISKNKQALDSILYYTGNVAHPDGTKAVSIFYMDAEVMVGAKLNQDRFLKDVYPYFVARAQSYGITPSLYFTVEKTGANILDNSYTDPQYPVLNKHKSLYWLYRSTEFLRNNNLPVPTRLDFSFYVHPYAQPVTSDYATLINRVMDDIHAVYGPNQKAGIAETQYPEDASERLKLGRAYATAYRDHGNPQVVTFWTTPQGSSAACFPFDFTAYYLPGSIPPPPLNHIPGDLDCNGHTDNPDYIIFIRNFGRTWTDPNGWIPADINKNGKVDIFDYNILVGNFGK